LTATDPPTPPPTAPTISTTTRATTSQKVVRRSPQITLCRWGYCCKFVALFQMPTSACGYAEVECNVGVNTGFFIGETTSSPESCCDTVWGRSCADLLFCIAREHREAGMALEAPTPAYVCMYVLGFGVGFRLTNHEEKYAT
jgi:hypothetical protein